jgi:hypothetical protein
MANDNLAYLIIGCCVLLVALMVKYTRGDMRKGLQVIRQCWPF